MSVSDLTGTTWVINEEPSIPASSDFNYNINFTSILNVETTYFNAFNINNSASVGRPSRGLRYHDPNSGYLTVYQILNNTWYSESAHTISITSGTDVTNSDLITWLESNATQIIEEIQYGYQDQPYNIMGCLPMGASLEPGETSNSPTLITFTIAGTTYQAEEGMTWGEWVESEYNTFGYYISEDYSNYIVAPGGGSTRVVIVVGSFILYDSYTYVLKTDIIVSQHAYLTGLITGGSGGSGRDN